MSDKLDRLFTRAVAILEGRANGFGVPILLHLAQRKYGPAMLWLACHETESGKSANLGRVRDAQSPAGLMYRAYRQGEINAAQNFALTLFYAGDLVGYRRWMRKAAQGGDNDAARELRRFEVRQPYSVARRTNRLRPFHRDSS